MEEGTQASTGDLWDIPEVNAMMAALSADAGIQTTPMIAMGLIDVPRRAPEDFLHSEPGPSQLPLTGYPLKATERVLIPPRTQVTVPVEFPPNAVRPSTDYVVEATPKKLAACGVVTAKTLVDGSENEGMIPLVNAVEKWTEVRQGSIIGWAFPMDPEDEITCSKDAKGRPDLMPYAKPPVRKEKRKDGRTVRYVHHVAVEDHAEEESAATKVGTDPHLEIPSSDEEGDDEIRADFEKHRIIEPTLTYKQK